MSESLDKLKTQLELQDWPNVYMFKFIMINKPELMAKVLAIFDEHSDVLYKSSKNAKYMSISVKELMLDVNSILDKYKKASQIEGVIAL